MRAKIEFLIITAVLSIASVLYGQAPSRLGVALGYMTTPNSIVYRNTFSENSALDLWLDIPEFDVGDITGWQVGFGAGYAMFISRQTYMAFMLRPQIWVGYHSSDAGDNVGIGLGVAGAVVAYLDSLGVSNTDVYAGVSAGSIINLGDNFSYAHLLLSYRKPFGVLIGVMKYF